MAEPRQSRSRSGGRSGHNGNDSGSDGSGGGDEAPARRKRKRSGLSAREAVVRVREEFPSLLGRNVESVLGVQRDEDDDGGGGWQVMVQVVELARIPNSTDVLGAYQVTLDEDGELVGYQRRRRYNRSQADED